MRDAPIAADIDHWLSRLPPEQRSALEKLRAQIHAAAPGSEEKISYGQPTFMLHGHLVAFGAFKKHLSFFPMNSSIIAKFPEASSFLDGWRARFVGTLDRNDPVAAALLHAAASRGLELDAFVVRKESKAHGLQRRVEGPDVAGKTVVAVEDTSTTGGSVLTAVEALREAGANVVAVAVIVDRDTGAREKVEAEGLPYLSLYGLADLGLD